jgi:ribonuclease E
VSSVALQLLRAIEDTLNKGATHNVIVRTRSEIALYVLNHKRSHLRALEERFRITITISADPTVNAQVSYIVDRGEQMHTPDAAKAIAAAAPPIAAVFEEDDYVEPEPEMDEDGGEAIIAAPSSLEEIDSEAAGDEAQSESSSDGDGGPRKRRRRGRGRGRSGEGRGGQDAPQDGEPLGEHVVAHEDHDGGSPEADGQQQPEGAEVAAEGGENGDGRRRRRRGRRGGRRNRNRDGETPMQADGDNGNDASADTGNDGLEPELVSAVEDLDRPPAFAPSNGPSNGYENAPAYAPPADAQPAPDAASAPSAETSSADAVPQEPPRRRSTIREPAPIAASGGAPTPATTLPPPTPVIVSTAGEDAAPKRGWWGKRLLGDKS